MDQPPPPSRHPWLAALAAFTAARRWRLLALFLVVVGARFWLIHRYSAALPMWDQWDGEGMAVIKPFLEGTLRFRDLFAAHNEHRIFLTRTLALGLFAANGQWDAFVEMAVNAVLCGVGAVGIAGAAMAAFQGRFQRTILAAVGVYFVLPFGWENTLAGFQSQNDFLVLFSLLAVWGLGMHRPGSSGWWAGLAGAALACLSMATGFLAAAAVLGGLALRFGRERRRPAAGEIVTGALCGVIVAVGWLTRVEVPWHAVLKAESVPAFFSALGRFLAWPLYDGSPSLGALAVAPTALLLCLYLKPNKVDATPSDADDSRRAALLLAVSGWAVLQTAALAYGRGGHGVPPACRYMDLLGLVPLTNFFVWLALLVRARRTAWRWPVLLATIVWTGWISRGLKAETDRDFQGWLPAYRQRMQTSERNVRGYLATHDYARFLAGRTETEIPYPDSARLASFLDDATLRGVLPVDVREPLRWEQTGEAAGAFVPDGSAPACPPPPWGPAWGSYAARGGEGTGSFHLRARRPAALPYLRFAFAGDLGAPDLGLTLRDADSGRQVAWHPRSPAGARWHEEDVPSPGRALRLEAVDRSTARWFAFSGPVEMGGWSRWTGFALRRGDGLLLAGLLLIGGLELVPLSAGAFLAARRFVEQGPAPAHTAPAATGPLNLLSVVLPARDEEKCIVSTVEHLHAELRRAGVPHEILVVDDGSTDGTASLLLELRGRVPELRPLTNTGRHGFGRAIIFGLDHMRGDAVVIMMADESDSPADVVRYWETLREGYDCAFGSRFVRGSRVVDYPGFKLAVNRLANLFIRSLFNVPCNDVTNAFKAYRREVIEGCRPLISAHFNLTVELPLKAMVRGFRWKVVPITWRNRKGGATKFKLKEMGSRYLFVCLYLWLEKHLSRGDYRRQ